MAVVKKREPAVMPMPPLDMWKSPAMVEIGKSMKPKKPNGFKAFDELMRKLVKVPLASVKKPKPKKKK